MNEPFEYILGTSDAELVRLGYQHQVWGNEAQGLWKKAGFGFGHRLIDLGSGPGYATLDMAHLVGPAGHVAAFDVSARYLGILEERARAARVEHISTHQGDAHRLPFSDAEADGAFARWLLCFVEDPGRVLSEAHRCLRPGGALVIMDYFNYLGVGMFPVRESFQKLFRAYHQNVTRHGGSYDVGNVLPGMLSRTGFTVERIDPICRISRPGSREWIWLRLFTDGHVPALVEEGLMTEEDHAQLNRDWEELGRDSQAFFFTPPMMGIVARKE